MMGTGGGAFLMPPAEDVCQKCAIKHDPAMPHNNDSLYWQYYFYSRNGRWPVWKDALAHCSLEVQEAWKAALQERGVWKEPGQMEVLPTEDYRIGSTTHIKKTAKKKRRNGQ